jgi:DNA polymerase III alpha subunit
MEKVRIKFIAGAEQAKVVSKEVSDELFSWIRESQRYSFNKSHAVSYAINGYYSAYCKAHFPVQFFCSYLRFSHEKQKPRDEIKELINEAKLMDIEVLPPDIRNLSSSFYIMGNIITFGLADIKGIGESHIAKIIEKVNQLGRPLDKLTWYEFLIYLVPEIGVSITEKLISTGALRYMNVGRRKMLADLDAFDKLSPGEKLWMQNKDYNNLLDAMQGCLPLKKEGGGTHDKRRQETIKGLHSLLVNPPHSLEDYPQWVAGMEEAYLGIPITCSRVDACDLGAVNASCVDFIKGNTRPCVILGVEVENVRECKIKNGQHAGRKMAHVTINDGTASLDITCFADAWKEYKSLLSKGNMVILQGEKDRSKGGLIVRKVWQANLLAEDD